MATLVGSGHRIYLAHLDLSGLANKVNFGDLTRDMKDSTTFNDGGYKCVKPGLITGEGNVSGFQDFAADVLDDEISIGQLGSQYPFTVIPSAAGTVTAGDTAWFSRGLIGSDNPLGGAKGEMASFEIGVPYDTVITQGKVLYPSTATTSDTNGTAVALTGPTASQSLYAALHVTAYSGLTNAVIKIQSDDSGAMSSPTDRITFTTVTGTTYQFTSVAGSFSSETHLRATIDVTGTGSITCVVVAGVL